MENKNLAGIALGIFLGFVFSIAVVWALVDAPSNVAKLLSDHITHAVTLLAAALALFGISKQIQSNFDLTERTRLAKLDAARATLPIVLSQIHRLAMERTYGIACGKPTPATGTKWEISDVELGSLKECIEYANGIEKEMMLDICRIYQILTVRWEDLQFDDLFSAPVITTCNPHYSIHSEQFNAMTNWVALKSICDALFDYARGEASNPSSDAIKDNVIRTLEWVNTGGLSGNGGKLLTNNSNYGQYVESLKKHRKIAFVLTGWK
jgi:hypothetical protein